MSPAASALAGRFFTTEPPGKTVCRLIDGNYPLLFEMEVILVMDSILVRVNCVFSFGKSRDPSDTSFDASDKQFLFSPVEAFFLEMASLPSSASILSLVKLLIVPSWNLCPR